MVDQAHSSFTNIPLLIQLCNQMGHINFTLLYTPSHTVEQVNQSLALFPAESSLFYETPKSRRMCLDSLPRMTLFSEYSTKAFLWHTHALSSQIFMPLPGMLLLVSGNPPRHVAHTPRCSRQSDNRRQEDGRR